MRLQPAVKLAGATVVSFRLCKTCLSARGLSDAGTKKAIAVARDGLNMVREAAVSEH